MKSLLLAILLLPLALASVACDSKSPAAEGVAPASKPSAIPMNAAELHKAYKTNEVAADEQFKGKAVRVTGKLLGVSKDFTDAIYLSIHPGTEMGELEALHAYFGDEQKAALTGLKPGQVVTFEGRVDGFMMGSVMVKECTLVR